MNLDKPADPDHREPAAPLSYEPPRITDLGSLTDLTRGGSVSGEPDGYGDAGASGYIP